jgi:CBS domain-containing protein
MQAKDIMTTKVATVTSDSSVEEISELMLSRNISGVPVVGKNGAVLGIVTEGDLMLRKDVGGDGVQHTSWWLRLLSDSKADAASYIKTHGLHAAEVMTRDVITVEEDTPVGDIARILAENHIKRVPVLRDGKLAGIVSRVNLLRGLASRSKDQSEAPTIDDRAIKDAIVKDVDSQGWITHGSLNVIVTGGVVELWGWVDSSEERRALLLLAEAVEGVRNVEDHLGSVPRYLQSD